ncbi:MAG: hypothetical protein KIT19_01190 [Phycisphaeraceae bacterium]|nr:hypothetical protein [Phycisphaeraceae bacterium]
MAGVSKHECCRGAESAFGVEGLEPRRLLAGFVGIGFDRAGTTVDAIIVEGDATPSGLASGQFFVSGTSGRSTGTALAREWVEQRDGGGLFLRPSIGTDGRDIEIGANFWSANGFSAGWYAGVDTAPGVGQLQYMISRPTAATQTDLAGNWAWTSFQWNPTTGVATVLNGTLSISGNFIVWFATAIGAPPVARTTEITTSDSKGGFLTSRGEHVYLSGDKSVLLTVDMRESDGDLFIGIATRADTSATVAEVAGGYRFGIAAASVAAQQLFNTGTAGIGAQFLDLRGNGTAVVYGLADYDAGDLSGGVAGTWTLSGSTVVLRLTGSPAEVQFTVALNGSTLTPFAMISQQGVQSRVAGIATRAAPASAPAPTLLGSDAIIAAGSGRPLAYVLRSDGVWRAIDLIAASGGGVPQTKPSTQIVMWTDPKDGLQYVASATLDGLYLYREGADRQWTVRNLTTEISGSQVILNGITQFVSRDNARQVTIAGLAADGDLVMYRQTGASTGGNYAYSFNDVADEFLRPLGRQMPAFVGGLVSYVTPWNGQNIAGLNASGQIEVIWNSARTQGYWVLSNLSNITGAPPFTGGLTVYQTRWSGINIVGVNGTGQVVTTWWIPRFAGFWATSNLTTIASGPLLAGESVVAFHTPDGGLNIAGIKSNGEVTLYWWVPNSDNTWKIRELTQGDTDLVPRPTGELRAQVFADGSVNIFGRATDRSLIRAFWEPTLHPDNWLIQNVSSISI